MKFRSERAFGEYVRQRGGTAYLVGGALRDEVLGRVPHDRDYLVTGVRAEGLGFERAAAGVLGVHFPEIEALDVADRHDGSALNHTLKVVAAGRSAIERFSLLVHDAGKGLTPRERHPAHHGHDVLGEAPVRKLCRRLRAPKAFEAAGVSCATQHMRAKRAAEMRPGKLLNWVTAHRAHVSHIVEVSFLDSAHREGANYDDEVARFESVRRMVGRVFEVEKAITGKALLAEGVKPGKQFGEALFERRARAFQAARASAD